MLCLEVFTKQQEERTLAVMGVPEYSVVWGQPGVDTAAGRRIAAEVAGSAAVGTGHVVTSLRPQVRSDDK